MPTTITPPSFARLRDNSWGVRVHNSADLTGDTVTVVRRNGTTSTVRLTRLVARYRDERHPALYAMEDVAPTDSPSEAAEAVTAADVAPRDGDLLAQPSPDTRTGRMLLAGGITATVTLPSGEHVTLRIKSRERTLRGWRNASLEDATTVAIRAGRSNVRAGRILRNPLRAQFFGVSTSVRDAVQRLFDVASGADVALIGGRLALADGYHFQVADRCGRCGRALTDPLSIERGIGPECFGHSTGSRHATVVDHSAESGTIPTSSMFGHADTDRPSLTALAADMEDEADRYMATHPVADADPTPEVEAGITAEVAQAVETETAPEVEVTEAPLTDVTIARVRQTMQWAFQSARTAPDSPVGRRQREALQVFDRLARQS